MKVAVTGATGFVGRPLCALLTGEGHKVTALVRDVAKAQGLMGASVSCVAWNEGAGDGWKRDVAQADAVISLAGESVAGHKWTPDYKAKILSSRTDGTRRLVEAMRASEQKPGVFVSASAIGYYGDRKDEPVTEQAAPAQDFLAQVCVAWEDEAKRAEDLGVRVARMRIGVVLGPGGALEKMLHPLPLPLNPYKLGAGGPMGSGKQWMSWVHLDDVIGLFAWAMKNDQVRGACNVTAPNPVTNAEFAHTLGRIFHRPTVIPVPAFALKAALGEFAQSLLTGQKVLPQAAERLGYPFKWATLEPALRALVSA